jgi:hypothetical protein
MSGHGHGAHGSEENKKVALLISVLALLLAVAEILGQSAQTKTLQSNIEASNLWAFFQAKTIRKTVAETAADEMETMLGEDLTPAQRKRMEDRVARWRSSAQRFESEPKLVEGKEKGEGRKELMQRALEAETARDRAGKKHYRFELGTGSFQIAIVLASAAVITGMTMLLWCAGGLGGLGILFLLSGMMA